MDIHIRSPIEFEKHLDHQFENSINITRQRMSVQQLLDQQEDIALIKRHLEPYSTGLAKVLTKLKPSTVLLKQPVFKWSVDGEEIQSSCWLFEAIMTNVILAQMCNEEANAFLKKNEIKKANALFKSAGGYYDKSMKFSMQWKWKLPSLTHRITHPYWHLSQKHMMDCYQHFCCQTVGIQQNTTASAMFKVAQRALKSSLLSWAHWKTPQSEKSIHMADKLCYLYSSHVLWDETKYGASIFRMQKWLGNRVDTGSFHLIKEEFEKIPLLLQERIHTNNGAYFDPIAPDEEFPNIEEIMRV